MSQVWGPASARPLPRLLASLPCEDAAVSVGLGDGRVTLERVFFDLYAGAFPAGFDRLVIACLWTGGEGEYKVEVRLVAPDGVEVGRGGASLTARPEPATTALVIYFAGLALPAPGRYTVEVLLGGAAVHSYGLHAVLIEQAAAAKPEKEDEKEERSAK